jgi:hypothetical protein
VIGPAVNLVSRVEAVAKAPDLPIVVSEALARAYAGNLRSLGRHELQELSGSRPDPKSSTFHFRGQISTSRPISTTWAVGTPK